jgi:hypothetical protein
MSGCAATSGSRARRARDRQHARMAGADRLQRPEHVVGRADHAGAAGRIGARCVDAPRREVEAAAALHGRPVVRGHGQRVRQGVDVGRRQARPVGDGEARVGHAQWRQHQLVHRLRQRASGHAFDDGAQDVDRQRVDPALPGFGRERRVGDPAHRLRHVREQAVQAAGHAAFAVGRAVVRVVRIEQPRRVRQQLARADRGLAAVGQAGAERRQPARDRRVEG